jgi:hypothetical protein
MFGILVIGSRFIDRPMKKIHFHRRSPAKSSEHETGEAKSHADNENKWIAQAYNEAWDNLVWFSWPQYPLERLARK